jgi:hypothetical protein
MLKVAVGILVDVDYVHVVIVWKVVDNLLVGESTSHGWILVYRVFKLDLCQVNDHLGVFLISLTSGRLLGWKFVTV